MILFNLSLMEYAKPATSRVGPTAKNVNLTSEGHTSARDSSERSESQVRTVYYPRGDAKVSTNEL